MIMRKQASMTITYHMLTMHGTADTILVIMSHAMCTNLLVHHSRFMWWPYCAYVTYPCHA